MDNKLTWGVHIGKLISKLKSTLVIIRRIKNYVPKEVHLSIYRALFESHINYCISTWGNAVKNLTEKVFRLQKQCIRILFGDAEAYFKKFLTCARVRPIEEQKLGS